MYLVTSHLSLLLSSPCARNQTGERPANPALWWVNGKGDEVKWSFGELGSLSRKAANVLTKSCGLERGDRVAVVLPRIPEWWLVNVACMRAGQCHCATLLDHVETERLIADLFVLTEARLTRDSKIRVNMKNDHDGQ